MANATIFDLFGTLVSLPQESNPYLNLCRDLGVASRIREALVVDAPTLGQFCDYLEVAHPPNLSAFQGDLDAEIENASLFPDALPTLQQLRERGIRIAVISNLASPYKRVFTRLGMETFVDAVLFSCDLGIAKPSREIYLSALAQLDVPAPNVIMVGDNQRADVDGPMSCGIRGLLLDRSRERASDSALESLTDVIRFLK